MKFKDYILKNKTYLCIGAGFALNICAIIELCKATVTATRKIDEKKEEIAEASLVKVEPKDVKIPPMDVIRLVGKDYIPGFGMVLASFGLVGGAIVELDK